GLWAPVAGGAVLRPTSDAGAHAAGRSGGKGGSSPRDAGRVLAFRRGIASVSRGAAATGGARDDQAEILQAARPFPHGEDGRELRGGAGGAACGGPAGDHPPDVRRGG